MRAAPTQPTSRAAEAALALFQALRRRRRERREAAELHALDDAILKDIGLYRGEIPWAVRERRRGF